MHTENVYYRRTELRAVSKPWHGDRIELVGWQVSNTPEGKSVAEILPAQMRTLTEAETGIEGAPFMSLTTDEAQRLIDELYRVGLRPSEMKASDMQVAAMKDHLSDLRHIIFKTKP